MAEWENPKIFDSGYGPDVEIIRLDLYRLLNQFLASPLLSDMCDKDAHLNHAMYSLDHFFEIEATRILLSSAVIARVIDDRDNMLKEFDTGCGELIPNLDNPNHILDLNLRGACNKIIHAKTIKYDIEVGIQGYDQRVFKPYIYYYGSKGKTKWKATLNVVDYIKRYTDNVVY